MTYTSYSATLGPRTDVHVSVDSMSGTLRLGDPDTHSGVELTLPLDAFREIACLMLRRDPHLADYLAAPADTIGGRVA